MGFDANERIVNALENRAPDAIEKESEGTQGPRVRLPLIRSAKQGSLPSLTNAEIDDIIEN
jgi:hypothetical protein